jgi:hypothetical protein
MVRGPAEQTLMESRLPWRIMIRTTNRFVCAECNKVVETSGGRGLLRCEQGHRLQGARARPFWLETVIAAFVGFVGGSLLSGLAGIGKASPGIASAIVSLLLSGFAIHLLVRSARYHRAPPGPVHELVGQYRGSASGLLIAGALFAIGAYAELSR